MGRARSAEDLIPGAARGRDGAAPALPGWTRLTSVASSPPGSRVAQPLPAEEPAAFGQRRRLREFVDLSLQTAVVPWTPGLRIPAESAGKLAPEGGELEFRWVIPRGALAEMFGEDEEGDVPMSKADTFLPDT